MYLPTIKFGLGELGDPKVVEIDVEKSHFLDFVFHSLLHTARGPGSLFSYFPFTLQESYIGSQLSSGGPSIFRSQSDCGTFLKVSWRFVICWREAKSNLDELLVFLKECNTDWGIRFVSFPQQTFVEKVAIVFEWGIGDLKIFFVSIKHVFRAIFSGNYLGCVLQRVALVRTANRLIFMRLDKSRILPTRVHRTAYLLHFQIFTKSFLTLFCSSLCFVFNGPIELVLLGHSLQLLRTGEENWSILENVPEMTLAIINKKKDVQAKMTLAIIY